MLKAGKPRHEQISDILREQILSGELAANDQLPSENQLLKKFDVSRITVRRALQTLESEGFIYRRQGLGAFVSDKRVHQGLVRLTDFVEDMSKAGIEATSRVLEFTQEIASEDVCEALQLKEGKMVCRLDRLRLGNGKPIAFDRTWLPVFYGQLLAQYDLQQETIYGILEEDYEIPIVKGKYRLAAANSTEEISDFLEVPQRSALFLIERTSFTKKEQPVYFQRRYYRNDMVSYELELERLHTSPDTGAQGMPLREFFPVFKEMVPGD